MDALYDLKDLLVSELESYGKKGEMSASVLERVDMLAHATKNLDKVIECMEGGEEYSGDGGSYRRRSSYRRSYDGRSSDGGSNRSYRRNSRRSRYSEHNDLTERLRDMMDEAPDDRSRQEIERLVNKMEQM